MLRFAGSQYDVAMQHRLSHLRGALLLGTDFGCSLCHLLECGSQNTVRNTSSSTLPVSVHTLSLMLPASVLPYRCRMKFTLAREFFGVFLLL